MKVALCHHKDCTVHGILQARILEWAAVLQEALLQDIFSRGRSSLGDLPNPGIEPRSLTFQEDSLLNEPPGKPKNTGVGSLFLLQWIFPTQESNLGLLHCRQILYQLSYQGSQRVSLPVVKIFCITLDKI